MPSLQSPTVFVSSTCYDLNEIRDQLKTFIEGLGFDAMLSEFDSFPVNPLEGTVDNCRKNVEEFADILVLIIGIRYGSTDESGRSITNLEYLQARAKGIPVYVFISRTILEQLPVWKENPEARFSGVDSTTLFEFAESVRNIDGQWTYPFDKAADIQEVLKKQWPYLFQNALQFWRQARTGSLPDSLSHIRGEALRLVVEKPKGWEYRLYSQVLYDGLCDLRTKKLDRELGVVSGEFEQNVPQEVIKRIINHHNESMRKSENVMKLFRENVLEKTFGELGKPGDPERICHLAQKLVGFYQEALEWSLRCRRFSTAAEMKRLLELSSRSVDNVIPEIEEFSNRLQNQLLDAIEAASTNENPDPIRFDLELTYPEGLQDELNAELMRIAKLIEIEFDMNSE